MIQGAKCPIKTCIKAVNQAALVAIELAYTSWILSGLWIVLNHMIDGTHSVSLACSRAILRASVRSPLSLFGLSRESGDPGSMRSLRRHPGCLRGHDGPSRLLKARDSNHTRERH